jgi:tripartite-type tricarboxylate transporter receptor subunit TctC
VARLNAEIVKIMQMPEIRKRINELGFLPQSSSPEDMATRIRTETAYWTTLIKSTGLVLE